MKIFNKMSLRSKWMAFISLAIVLAVVITVIFSQWSVRSILEKETKEGSSESVQNAVDQISLSLSNYENSLLQMEHVMESLVASPTINFAQMDEILNAINDNNSEYLTVYFMDFTTGKLHIAPSIDYQGDVRDTNTYKNLKKNSDVQWMDVYLDKTVNKLMTSVIAPVMKNDELVGAVGFDLDFSTIGEIRESIEEQSDSKLMILDPAGLIVSSFIRDGDGTNIVAKNSGQEDGVSDLLDPKELDKQFSWLTNASNNNNHIDDFEWEGVHYTGELKTIEKNNWQIVSFTDTNIYASTLKNFSKVGWISVLVGLIIGCLLAFFMSKRLINIFGSFKKVFEKTANGDFVSRFETNRHDEIADLADHYNNMLDHVRQLITDVNTNASAIQNVSNSLAIIAKENEHALQNVSNSVEEIATNTSNQSKRMQQGADAVGVLTGSIVEINDRAIEMVQTTTDALSEVNMSIQKVQDLEHSYENLEQAFNEVTTVTNNLDEKTKQISNVTDAIAQITDQTNLLALNASIEAARAGEHGKGFAVVAEEVRSLAESSKAATANIQQIILSILTDTEKLVKVIEHTNANSDEQKSAVASVNQSINQLSKTITSIKESMGDTMQHMSMMQQQKDVVVETISNVNEMTNEVTAETQEIASSIEEQTSATSEVTNHAAHLRDQVKKLNDTVSKFKL